MQMKYKYSFYNIETQLYEKTVNIWNSRTGSIVVLPKEVYEKLIAGIFDCKEVTDCLADLLKQGIVVNKELDEFQAVRFKSKQRQFQFTNKFSVVIAPTLNCNFNCFYCFEHSYNDMINFSEMSTTLITNVVEFIEKNIKKIPNIRYLDIHWFGGEPLLKYNDIILPILKKLRTICEKEKIVLDSYIVTNGFYLTKEKYKEFIIECCNTHFQITFDGTAKEYAERKGVTEKAYEIVKKNLIDLSNFLFLNKPSSFIDVRLNADNKNYENLKLFISEIKQECHANVRFHLGRLRNYTLCGDNYFSLEQFWETAFDFNSFLNKRIKIEEPKPVWCGQYCVDCICIGPNGELYKCEHDFGKSERVVGDVFSGLYYNKYYCDYMNLEVSHRCNECKLYPICLGGCPSIRFDSRSKCDCEYSIDYSKKIVNSIIENTKV